MVKEFGVQVRGAVGRIVVGREAELSALLVGVLSEGHLLLEGPPGTAKTLLVRALAALCGVTFRRVQFTPDLMPSDVVGTNVFEPQTGTFRLAKGPVFSDFVLADEINRAPAKTQAALLESMEEHRVTLDGVSHPLPDIFTVFATMNPIEFEGTFPLPEAQLDRFLLKIPMPELAADAELEVLARYARGEDPWRLSTTDVQPIVSQAGLVQLRAAVRAVGIEESVQRYLLEIVRRTRTHPAASFGASTRAAVALLRAARAHAALLGRSFVIPDDVKFLAPFALAHRVTVRPEAMIDDVDGRVVVRQILEQTPVPRVAA
jgi:MoxR-like ATPase